MQEVAVTGAARFVGPGRNVNLEDPNFVAVLGRGLDAVQISVPTNEPSQTRPGGTAGLDMSCYSGAVETVRWALQRNPDAAGSLRVVPSYPRVGA